jgi:hypothetical protein
MLMLDRARADGGPRARSNLLKLTFFVGSSLFERVKRLLLFCCVLACMAHVVAYRGGCFPLIVNDHWSWKGLVLISEM